MNKIKLLFVLLAITPIFFSCKSEDFDSTRNELENATEEKILSLYHKAIEDGHTDCLELTLQKNAIALEVKLESKSSLLSALEDNNVEVVKLFLGANIQPDYYFEDPFVTKKNMTLLMVASGYGSIDVVNLLVTKKVNVNFQREDSQRTALMYAAMTGKTEVYKKLIKSKADVGLYDKDGLSAVHYAAQNNFSEIVELSKGYENYGTKEGGFTPLMYAVAFNKTECIEKLATISDLNYKTPAGWTALHVAANQGTPAEIEILLKCRCNSSLKTNKGFTPLEIAVNENKADNVKAILAAYDHSNVLSYGVEISVKDGSISFESLGKAILRASYFGYDDILKLLFDNAVEKEKKAKDENGNNALILAIEGKHPSTAKFLIENTNLINSQTNDGFTPIMVAIQNNDKETFNLLLEKNCDLKQKTKSEETVFTIAEKSENKEFYKKLTPKRVLIETQLNMVKIPGYRFEVSKYEVTQELYEKVMGFSYKGNLAFEKSLNPKKPAIMPWNRAIYFCNKLSEMCGLEPVYSVNGTTDYRKWENPDGEKFSVTSTDHLYPSVKQNYEANGFRMPLVKEWDIAVNGDKEFTYSGSNDIDEVGWYGGNSNDQPHKIGLKKPNAYGLYDMTGNASEWCWTETSSSKQREWFPAYYAKGGSYNFNSDACEVNRPTEELMLYDALGVGLRLFRTVVKKSE